MILWCDSSCHHDMRHLEGNLIIFSDFSWETFTWMCCVICARSLLRTCSTTRPTCAVCRWTCPVLPGPAAAPSPGTDAWSRTRSAAAPACVSCRTAFSSSPPSAQAVSYTQTRDDCIERVWWEKRVHTQRDALDKPSDGHATVRRASWEDDNSRPAVWGRARDASFHPKHTDPPRFQRPLSISGGLGHGPSSSALKLNHLWDRPWHTGHTGTNDDASASDCNASFQ